MRWIRFVADEASAAGREQTHICEHQLEVAVVRDWDLSSALRAIDEPFVMVEWDIAFEPLDAFALEYAIAQDGEDVHVAPYRLHPQSTGLDHTVWAHRRWDEDGADMRWVDDDEARCDLFGLGMVYFPSRLLEVAHRTVLRDHSFDLTLSRAWGRGANIVWTCRPLHLHWAR